MPDLLVKLYELPDPATGLQRLQAQSVQIRPAMPYEKANVVAWVRAAFGEAWAGECDVAFANRPISCFIATAHGAMTGFACYDSTCRGFFGPVGVASDARGQGLGTALLLACLHTMRTLGYGYAIIGAAGDSEFYRTAVGATPIEGSSPGIYRDRLTR